MPGVLRTPDGKADPRKTLRALGVGRDATLRVVLSSEGHDGFLLEHGPIGDLIREALDAPVAPDALVEKHVDDLKMSAATAGVYGGAPHLISYASKQTGDSRQVGVRPSHYTILHVTHVKN